MTKTRWIKVTVTLKEGDSLGEWSAVDLAETEMLQSVGGDLLSLGMAAQTAAQELIERGRVLIPVPTEATPPLVIA
jgi:hypothetical protein